jgi:hypothetical protein
LLKSALSPTAVLENAVLVAREGIRTDGGVSDAVKVAIKGERPIGRVFPAINVGKKGSGASGRIFFCEVQKQATGANGCVVAPGVMAAATSNQLPYCMRRS